MEALRRLVGLSLVALGTSACGGGGMPAGPPADVAAAQEIWSARGFTDYRFDFERSCFCVPEAREPVTIEVRGGEVARVVSRRTGQEVAAVDGIEWYSIEGLFELIRQAEEDGVSPIRVEYAPTGYPRSILIGELAADAGVQYTVGDVARL